MTAPAVGQTRSEGPSLAWLAAQPVLGKKNFALLNGWHPSYVTRLIERGRLTPPALREDGTIDVELARKQIAETADPIRGRRSHRPLPLLHVGPAPEVRPIPNARPEDVRVLPIPNAVGSAPTVVPLAAVPTAAPTSTAPLTEARTRREQAQAELAEMQLAKARGELVEVASVRELGETLAEVLRQQLRQHLGDELAQSVLGITDLRQALTTLGHAQDRILAAIGEEADRRVAELMARGG